MPPRGSAESVQVVVELRDLYTYWPRNPASAATDQYGLGAQAHIDDTGLQRYQSLGQDSALGCRLEKDLTSRPGAEYTWCVVLQHTSKTESTAPMRAWIECG
jgi:hypothetical protein